MDDLILDGSCMPTLEQIEEYIRLPARRLWRQIHAFVQQEYAASPKTTFSKCYGKPGWNVKYQKSGKSICTLYPENDRFIALVVITPDVVRLAEAQGSVFETEVQELIRRTKPFNGTLWLMIAVENEKVLENVKTLIRMKQLVKRKKA
ncbi:MAG: DUF3788 domain-containing protein [Bacillota bacterium]